MHTFYKATRTDGTDFYTGTIDYAAKVGGGKGRPPSPKRDTYRTCSNEVLHAADVPTMTLIGGRWPCRLFEVTGKPVAQEGHKFGFRQLTVVKELPAHLVLGPQGEQIAALIERAKLLKLQECKDLHAAWAAAGDAAWAAARDAAWAAARDAAWAAAWAAARDAARAAAGLTVRDLIGSHGFTQAHYDLLTGPWAQVIGKVHPDD